MPWNKCIHVRLLVIYIQEIFFFGRQNKKILTYPAPEYPNLVPGLFSSKIFG